MGGCCATQADRDPCYNKPSVRMCSSGNHFPNFADIGNTVVLFVDFGDDFKPVPKQNLHYSLGATTAGNVWPDRSHLEPEQYEIKLAGLQAFLKKLKPKDRDCRSFRAEARILMTDEVLDHPGELVKFTVPYSNNDGQYQGVVTEKDVDTKHAVYHYPLWDELIEHNQDIREELRHRTSSRLIETTYGSMGRQRHSLLETAVSQDQVDAATASASVEVLTATARDEQVQLLQGRRAVRYWPDSWEMSWWRRACCDPIMRSRNCFTRFWATFFVSPLTNVTGLSLYYQLYLVEIFHLKFGTRIGHYIFMPLIVMMMMTFFAQWRFDGLCYTLVNTEVIVLNGAGVMGFVFLLWYTIWGLVQRTPCLGLFMTGPMVIIYILANITFQMAVKNSIGNINCTKCWHHTVPLHDVMYFSAFKLMHWYYNPLPWVIVLCFGQALSHMFEPKIPPRVNQTAHWMSCSDMFKKYGYPRSFVIFLAQAVFGTVDELLASPRLLPLLMLRVCFTLGYQPKEWEVLRILVKKSLQYGDPALDYIGTGGAEYLPEDSVIPSTSMSGSSGETSSLDHTDSTGYNIGKLKRRLKEMENTLTAEHHKKLSDPRKLRQRQSVDDWLEHYIVLRHYVAKYELQVHAYGPFRTQNQNDEAEHDKSRMERDFPMDQHASFRNFLNEVRFHLWMMEDEMIEKRALSACCEKEL